MITEWEADESKPKMDVYAFRSWLEQEWEKTDVVPLHAYFEQQAMQKLMPPPAGFRYAPSFVIDAYGNGACA